MTSDRKERDQQEKKRSILGAAVRRSCVSDLTRERAPGVETMDTSHAVRS